MSLRVKAGDRVRSGQPLVRLDDREVRANTARSDAAVAQAEAEWRNASQVLERNRALRKEGFISQAAIDRLPKTLVRILRSNGFSRKSSAPARFPAIIFFRSASTTQ